MLKILQFVFSLVSFIEFMKQKSLALKRFKYKYHNFNDS